MKKILTAIFTIFLITTTVPEIYAHEGHEIIATETGSTLSESLIEEEAVEEKELSFGTILMATLTPTIFIVIGYLLIKNFD